jgi:MoaA/NifB/PqqE/SkfB family radical SAM enzyme
MTNKFCGYLSNGYSFNLINNDLTVKPCCFFYESVVFDQNFLTNKKEKFDSISGWTSNCGECKKQEQAGQASLRQASTDWIPADELSSDPVAIDIHLDNECNAACVTCAERFSSLWAKENSKLSNTGYTKFNKTTTDNAIDQIVTTVGLTKLQYVKFFGGEPLFTDTHLKFIKHIPHPDQVVLQYTTNGSIYPSEETLAAWTQFKLVIFSVSLDGVEEQFDYVRWPLPWTKVSENLLRLKNTAPVNMMFRVEFTANLFNTYYFDRLEQWVRDNFATNRLGDPTDLNIHNCIDSAWDLDKMPDPVRTAVLEKYPTEHRIHQMIASHRIPH